MSGMRSASIAVPTLRDSLEEYGRGVAGGLLFSLPLLYTMEMWWAGFVAHPFRLLLYVLSTFVLLLAYNRYAGLRDGTGFLEILIDSIEEMGIGLLLSTLILWLLNRINAEMSASEILGKIVIEAMTMAIGVSVGTAQLGATNQSTNSGEGDTDNENSGDSHSGNGDSCKDDSSKRNTSEQGDKTEQSKENPCEDPDYIEQAVIAFCGAVLIAANVGPTEEIILLATESPPFKLLAMALFSLSLCVIILHYSGFHGAQRFAGQNGFRGIMRGVTTTYAMALLASAMLCWFFGRFDGASLEIILAQTVTLAFPATLGASAGRLLLQANSP